MTATGDVIVTGDFNAKHSEWGSPVNDSKREFLADFIYSLGLSACNQEDKPTWKRGDSESCIDVTIVSINIAVRVTNWQVLEDKSYSKHNYIEFNIRDTIPR